MSVPSLKIAGIEIALQSFPATQSYAPINEGSVVHRMLNGAGVKQQHWRKLVTTITGSGWSPLPLAGVDWAVPVEILCIQPMALHSASNVAAMPTARRTDFADAVLCSALVGGELVPTPVNVVVNTATATSVAGATAYQFMYFPKLTCYSAGPGEPLDMQSGEYRWSITAEEV